MENKKYFINVYDTLSERYIDVEVSESVYHACKRDEWLARYKKKRFNKHETVFSGLVGKGEDVSDSFSEFASQSENPEWIYEREETLKILYEAFSKLSKEELCTLIALYYDGKSQRAFADSIGVSHTTVGKRNKRLLEKLREHFSL